MFEVITSGTAKKTFLFLVFFFISLTVSGSFSQTIIGVLIVFKKKIISFIFLGPIHTKHRDRFLSFN